MPNWEEDAFRQRVRDAIQAGGKSGVMSKKTGIPVDTLNKYVSLRSTPSAINALKIAEALGLSLEQLVSQDVANTSVTGFAEEQAPFTDIEAHKPSTKPADEVDNATVLKKLDFVVEQLTKMAAEKVEQKPAPVIPPRAPATVTYLPFRASAGGGSVVLEDSPGFQLDFDELSQKILGMRRKNMRLIEIDGDSMLPTFQSGDIVVADMSYPRGESMPDNGEIYVIAKEGELLVKRALWADGGVLQWTSDNPDYAPINVSGPDLNHVKIVGRVVWLWRRAH